MITSQQSVHPYTSLALFLHLYKKLKFTSGITKLSTLSGMPLYWQKNIYVQNFRGGMGGLWNV